MNMTLTRPDPVRNRIPEQHRTGVRLPEEIGAAVRELAAERQHDIQNLLFTWAYTAASSAEMGRTLPPAGRVPASPSGREDYLRWPQGADEAADWTRRIRAAKSSMRAVIYACAELYLAADGDLLRMAELWREAFPSA